jgi:TolB-like protein
MTVLCGVLGCALTSSAALAAGGDLRVMVAPVTTPPAVTAAVQVEPAELTSLVAKAVKEELGYTTVTVADLLGLLEESARQPLAGCDELRCHLDLARAGNVDLMVRGQVGLLGDQVVVSGALLDVKENRVINTGTQLLSVEELRGGGLGQLALRLFGRGIPGQTRKAALAEGGARDRVLVMAPQVSDGLADAAAQKTLLARATSAVASVGILDTMSADEVTTLVQSEADRQALGGGDEQTFSRLSAAMNARFLITMTVGRMNKSVVLNATLVDAKRSATVNRANLLLTDESQLADAVEVVVKNLLGQEAVLPPSKSDPARLEGALKAMSAQLKQVAAGVTGGAAVAVLPFTEQGAEVVDRKAGQQVGDFLVQLLGAGQPLALVPQEKVVALGKTRDLSRAAEMDTKALQEVGLLLGAPALLVGSVGDVGTEFLVRVRLVRTMTGETAWSGHALFPKGEKGSFVPKKALVVRTRADAVYRSALPGWGQVYNGQAWKAPVFVLGILGALLVAPVFVVVGGAVVALGGYQWGQPDVNLFGTNLTTSFGVARQCSDQLPESEVEAMDAWPRWCQMRFAPYAVAGAGVSMLSVLPLVIAALVHGAGFVDAAIFGADYSELQE